MVGGVALLNAPWVTAALVTGAGGSSDPAGVAAFAARSENWAGPLVALAGTGGVWSAQATPSSRAAPLVPLATLVLLILAGVGAGLLRRRLPPGTAVRLAVLAGIAFLLAALGVLPGGAAALRWAVVHLPGAGLLRDGQKFLAPYALLLVVCAALGAERLVARIDREVAGVVLVGLLLLPVAVMPDLAFGGAGRLRPVSYPADWQAVAERVAGEPGEILALPLSAYRAYPWNPGRVVLDPLPRYLPGTVLTDDTLGSAMSRWPGRIHGSARCAGCWPRGGPSRPPACAGWWCSTKGPARSTRRPFVISKPSTRDRFSLSTEIPLFLPNRTPLDMARGQS